MRRGDRVWYWQSAWLARAGDDVVPVPAMKLRAHIDRMYRRRRRARIRVQGFGRAAFYRTVPVIDLTIRRRERRT